MLHYKLKFFADPCVFVKAKTRNKPTVYNALYVDDGAIAGSMAVTKEFML